MSTRRGPGQYVRAHTTDIMLPAALVVLIIIGLVLFPSFRSVTNFFNILTFSSVLLIVAIGETFVVLGRAADLTVGSMVGLSGAILAVLSTTMPAVPAVALSIIIGTLIGALQGIIITKVRISFLIVTLGLYSILRSQVQVLLGGQSQNVDISWLQTLSNGYVGIVPNLVIIALVVFVVATLVLRGTGFGRALYAVGASPETARLAGIPVARVVIISFAISAFAASVAGILTVGTLGSAQTTAGSGMELVALSAVLLGGTRFSGGYGSATRTLVGVLFLGVLNSLLYAAGISSFWQGTASGLVLILAVALDRTRKD
ncbi:ABC transporter permease [Microbacterium sp. ASV49]|uniref:Autoinducer 2 import system permease protein LsrC n=1 Tax=Microbacterium candidum TaxID=3041922 RepID=A0ABT7MW92_9MICO|nr:ABC transporter permease [Microbacterium sp. ASV49]MDL9978688.1 ABC transporter permease [Microbacterium sp. ASV49]